MKVFTLLVVLMGLFLVSCEEKSNGKPRQNPNDGNTPGLEPGPSPSLFGKTAKDILGIKYSKASLNCGLWLKKGSALNLGEDPSDVEIKDLSKGTPADEEGKLIALFKSLTVADSTSSQFDAGLQSQSVKVDGKLGDIRALSTLVPDENGLYKLSYTLQLPLTLDISVTTKHSDASADLVEKSSVTLNIVESDASDPNKNSVSPFSTTIDLGGNDNIFKHLRCSFITEIKSDYRPADESLNPVL